MSLQAILAIVMCVFVAFPVHAAEAAPRNGLKGLKILVLSGSGAINSIPSKTSTAPVVEVRDELPKTASGKILRRTLRDPDS